MKVEIITRHAVANYGSLLQAYATQKIIEKLGYEAEIVNYVRSDENGPNIVETMLKRNKKWNRNICTKYIYRKLQKRVYEDSYNKFKDFREKYLKQTEIEYNREKDLKENLPIGDVYCTGSDQVWGKIGNVEFDPVYFLSFVPDEKKKISYAASFGKEEMCKELEDNLFGYLKRYKFISVREDSAKNKLEKIGLDCYQTLDPTLLLDQSDWNHFIKDEKKHSEGYVLIYQLHNNKKLEKYAEEFAKRVGKKLIRISISKLYKFKSGKLIFMPTPTEFLNYFKYADYVISDSFHATVFSIIFNKKVIDVLPNNTGTRITSLMKLLNMEDRIITNYTDFSLIEKEIDYSLTNKILEKEREKSIKLLKKFIEE